MKSFTTKVEKIRTVAQETDQEVSGVLGEMQKIEVRGAKQQDTYEQMSLDLRLLIKEERAHSDALEHKERLIAELTVSLRQLQQAQRALQVWLLCFLFSALCYA